MEEDKKKKKSKKKKNKQNKATESSVDGATCQNHVTGTGQDATDQVYETTDAQDDVVFINNVNQERPPANGTQLSTLAEAEKQYWREREAHLEEKIKKFQEEKDANFQKEVIFEQKIQLLVKEKDVRLAKEGSLLEQIRQLENEKAAYVLKEASLEDRVLQLEKEKDAYIQKEASLAEQIAELQTEKKAHVQKEVEFEQRINHLVDEAALFNLKKVSLDGKLKEMEIERESWMQENSNKEVIASLNRDNSRLQAQVVELEQLWNTLLQENQLLTEKISDLQSQMLNFERATALSHSSIESNTHRVETGNVESQMEAACTLVEKLSAENADLVEKVNELCIELNRRGLQNEMSSANSSVGTTESARVADSSAALMDLNDGPVERQKTVSAAEVMHEAGAKMLVSGERTQNGKDVDKDERNNGEYLGATNTAIFPNSSDIIEPNEIVQIPLDENAHQLMDLEAANNDETTEVALSDAPLIGAPFRLISFVARYVSGADLVEK